MARTLVCSLAGAVVGFLAGYTGINIVAGARPSGDTGGAILLIGSFLAGTGAIAGAIIGGVADLQQFFKRRAQSPSQASDHDQ